MINTTINFLPSIQESLIEIGALLGHIKRLPSIKPTPQLRKENKIRTIFATTKIEGNVLNYEEVTALIEGKRTKGKKKDVLEVRNTIRLYDSISTLRSNSKQDYLIAHRILMKGLIESSGRFRDKNVGIKGKTSSSFKMIFPEYKKVESLCEFMFDYITTSQDNFIIKSCMIHYLSVTIHPFEDGNGRLSRFWQSLYLSENHEIFEFLPVESLIRSRQSDYYEYLNLAQKADDATGFVSFMLSVLKISLEEGVKYSYEEGVSRQELRILGAKKSFGGIEFSRKEYLELHNPLSTSMATKDLKWAVSEGIINKRSSGSGTKYFF